MAPQDTLLDESSAAKYTRGRSSEREYGIDLRPAKRKAHVAAEIIVIHAQRESVVGIAHTDAERSREHEFGASLRLNDLSIDVSEIGRDVAAAGVNQQARVQ